MPKRDISYRRADVSDVPALVRIRHEGEAEGASEDRMARYLLASITHNRHSRPA